MGAVNAASPARYQKNRERRDEQGERLSGLLGLGSSPPSSCARRRDMKVQHAPEHP